MDIGNLAEWVAGVGTVGTLSVSLYLIQNERHLRFSAQARSISAWSEWRIEEPQNLSPRQYFAYVSNASEAPIFVEILVASTNPRQRIASPPSPQAIALGLVPAHKMKDYGLETDRFPPERSLAPHVEIVFRDINDTWWYRNSEGILRKGKRARLLEQVKGAPWQF